MRKSLVLVLVLVLVLFALVALPTPARSHASYKTSDPPDRSKVSSAPSSIWAEFTEPLASGSYLQIFDPCGERVDHGDTSISGYRMTVTQTSARAGIYTVRFRALSTLDPHEVNGSFTFTATGGDGCPDGGTEPEADAAPEETGGDGGTKQDDGGPTGATEAIEADQGENATAPVAHDHGKEKGGKAGSRRVKAGDTPSPRTEVLAQRRERKEPGLLEDIPLGSFAISLAMSALIGAAGGKVYAGIMGPRA